MESTLQIMPVQRISRNFGEYAEEAVIIEEPIIKQKRPLFIEANTIEASLEHLRNDCIIPVFAKDNEATLSHVAFIEAVQDATNTFFSGEQIESPDIRVSHVIKGRIPEAIHKPANQLLESDKTIYYERCAFVIEVPTIYETVHGNRLTLTIGGVRAYNHTNLYSKKGAERFKVFIGFTCKVCTNLCVSTDGYLSCLEVTNTRDLYQAVLEMFHKYDAAKHIHLMQSLGNTSMTEHQFCQLLRQNETLSITTTGVSERIFLKCCLLIHRLTMWLKRISMTRTLAAWEMTCLCGSSTTCSQVQIRVAI